MQSAAEYEDQDAKETCGLTDTICKLVIDKKKKKKEKKKKSSSRDSKLSSSSENPKKVAVEFNETVDLINLFSNSDGKKVENGCAESQITDKELSLFESEF